MRPRVARCRVQEGATREEDEGVLDNGTEKGKKEGETSTKGRYQDGSTFPKKGSTR